MDVKEAVHGRRSIRRFKEQAVSDELTDELLEAVRWAPSWGNSQCWEVVVVKDNAVKKKLSDALSDRNPAGPGVENAPLVFVLCAKMGKSGFYKGEAMTKFHEWFMYDLGLATQNLCLTAHSLGLGSVIAGAFDHEKVREILAAPDDVEAVTMIPVGFPDHISSAPKRRKTDEFSHKDSF